MIIQSVKMAWHAITSNKMRSFLTMLGIIIGVVSLVVLVSLVNGTTSSVTDSISSMGTNLLTVSVQDDKGKPLKLADLDLFTEDVNVALAAPVAQTTATAENASTSESASVYGTTAAYEEIQGMELAAGRFLKTTDVDNKTRVAVISADVATYLMGSRNPVGESIILDGISYQVIGVLEGEASSVMSSESSAQYDIYIPFTSLSVLSDSVSSDITSFVVSAKSDDVLDMAQVSVENTLLNRFANDDSAYSIRNQSTIMETMESVTNTLAMLLGGIAAISLLVGGIGIMNIMLVSVTERTREIGVRKAIGADRGSIMQQFLIEALMISLMGCLLGIAISFGILQIINTFGGASMNYQLSMQVVWISVIFSTLIGVLFGIYPANKAAKKKPIEALRYTG